MRNTHLFIRLTVITLLATAFPFGVCSAQANNASEPAPQGSGIEKVLDKAVDITFQDTHLQDILDFITENYGVNVIVDNRVIRPKDPSEADPTAKYMTNGVVSYVNLKNVTLREALKAVLRPLRLSYSTQKSFVWISTPEHLLHESFEELETRFYALQGPEVADRNADLRDIPLEPINIENLLRHVVPKIVEPTTSRVLSFMRFNEKTNAPVIHNTPSNHRIIMQALSLLDRSI